MRQKLLSAGLALMILVMPLSAGAYERACDALSNCISALCVALSLASCFGQLITSVW
jgi:hypothetical protein